MGQTRKEVRLCSKEVQTERRGQPSWAHLAGSQSNLRKDFEVPSLSYSVAHARSTAVDDEKINVN